MAECYVYWLYDGNCKNIETDGYVGISREPHRRLMEHRQSGQFSNVFCMEIVFEGSRSECISKEIKLRPSELIGWNNAPGGRTTPKRYGKMPRTTCENCGIETSIQLYKRYHGKKCGQPISEQEYLNRCKAQKGNSVGRVVSEETKAKTAATMTGKRFGPCSDERKQNISKAKKGKKIKATPKSSEHLAKIAEHNRQLGIKKRGTKQSQTAVANKMLVWIRKKQTRLDTITERWINITAQLNLGD